MLFVAAHFFHHLCTALPIPLLPYIRDDFGLDYTQSGLVLSAFSLAYGISQLPTGWLADRVGPRILIATGISGVAFFGILVGISPTYMLMLVFMVLMGVAAGGYHPSAPPLISTTVDAKNRGRAFGIHMIGGSSSYFLAPLAGAAIASVWGWRGSFLTLAVPAIVIGIVVYIFVGRRIATNDMTQKQADISSEKPMPTKKRHLVALILLSAMISAVVHSINDFIPLYMVDNFGVSRETAAFYVALIAACGIWVGPIGGILSDRFNNAKIMTLLGFFASLLMFIFKYISYGAVFGIFLVAVGMVVYIRMPVTESFIIRHTSRKRQSTVLGMYFFAGMEGTGILMPIFGSIIDNYGFYTATDIGAAMIFGTSAICAALLWDSHVK